MVDVINKFQIRETTPQCTIMWLVTSNQSALFQSNSKLKFVFDIDSWSHWVKYESFGKFSRDEGSRQTQVNSSSAIDSTKLSFRQKNLSHNMLNCKKIFGTNKNTFSLFKIDFVNKKCSLSRNYRPMIFKIFWQTMRSHSYISTLFVYTA